MLSSIIVHGSSIAVFTLGKHINTNVLPSISMTFTRGRDSEDGGPTWLDRLPRLELGHSMTFSKSRDRSKSRDETGGPVDQNAIGSATAPTRHRRHQHVGRRRSRHQQEKSHDGRKSSDEDLRDEEAKDNEAQYLREANEGITPSSPHYHEDGQQIFREGDKFIVEDDLGEVIKVVSDPQKLSNAAAHNLLDKEDTLDDVSRIDREKIAQDPAHPLYSRIKGFVSGLSGAHPDDSTAHNRSTSRSASSPENERSSPSGTSDTLIQGNASDQSGVALTESHEEHDETETSVERRRRQAALGISSDKINNNDDYDEQDEEETPAERKRRMQALGQSEEPGESHRETSFNTTQQRPQNISFHASVDDPASARGRSRHNASAAPQQNLLTVPEAASRSTSHSRSRSIVWADRSS